MTRQFIPAFTEDGLLYRKVADIEVHMIDFGVTLAADLASPKRSQDD